MEEDCDRGFVVMMASFTAEANGGGAAKDHDPPHNQFSRYISVAEIDSMASQPSSKYFSIKARRSTVNASACTAPQSNNSL
ncbi:hypothetical protein NC652_040217 [Populus alba x Populus x berolinensis]|nr:hypothetical protein NC652_040217 [Populus alba x Populus x berolinensis]